MIESADWLCEKHFGKSLIDSGVEILDPATGTGTFICELLEHFRGQREKMAHKYKEELHANEVAILPYYVANLNIEATYAAITGQYAEYPNLCFVDTLDNVAGLGKFSGYQEDMFGAMSDENVARIKRQNGRKISVIIGNPPYNANQQNENDKNKNREYRRIDERIKGTYIAESTAQKTKLYDMYARFFRWASDRIKKEGIIAFITNRSFLDSRTFDGFRKIVARDFQEIWIVDLGGDVRANPKISGTKNNVFGIQTGVAISFLVKGNTSGKSARIFYTRRPELELREDKLAFVSTSRLASLEFLTVRPDEKHVWLNQVRTDFGTLIPIASKSMKGDQLSRSVFRLYSLGIVTNRDEWLYDDDRQKLDIRTRFFIRRFNEERRRWIAAKRPKAINDFVARDIKWTSELEVHLQKGTKVTFDQSALVTSLYRPFVLRWTYFAPVLTHRLYQNFHFFRSSESENIVIAVAVEDRVAFSLIATNRLPNKDMFMPSAAQCFARFRFTDDGTRLDNITDWALDQFRAHYNPIKPPITKDAIFHYVYAVLHDPFYREKYALNLKREFPRIPFYADFWRWAEWGEALMALHIRYETVEPWPLKRIDTKDEKSARASLAPKVALKADKDGGIIILDSETQLSGVPAVAWRYRLGNRSGLEWILDQYKEKTPKDLTIREKFNFYRFADYKEKVIDLLGRVSRVSVETIEIIDAMKAVKR
jgi:predicted helicase